MGVKISIIGAGSAVFSISLVRDLCLMPRLGGATVSFMDVNRGRLDTVHALCVRYAAETGARLKLEKTVDRRKSLEGADFVVNSALAAGHDRLQAGWRIAKRHGYRLGGSLHICHDEAFWVNFHQLKLMEAVLRDIRSVCPRAWYVLIANPVLAGVAYLTRKYPAARIVGLCHGTSGAYVLPAVLGHDGRHASFEMSGVNHFVWLTGFRYRGKNAFPAIDRWLRTKAKRYWRSIGMSHPAGPKPFDLYRKLGAFPVGDTANPGGGAWPWWYHTDRKTERRWREDPNGWYAGHFRNCRRQPAWIGRIAGDRRANLTTIWPPKLSGEPTIPLIESLAGGRPRRMMVNILNTGGLVPGIPEDFSVEVRARVDRRGIHGRRARRLPDQVLAWTLRDRVVPVETEIAAFAGRSYGKLLELVLMDPWTRSESQARRMLNAILAMPCHREMRAHYR